MEKTIEEKTADAILERPVSSVTVGGHTFQVQPPTPATLILVSALTSRLPPIRRHPDNILAEVLRTAKDSEVLGRIAAALILGAKRIKENRTMKRNVPGRRWSWRRFRLEPRVLVGNEYDCLADLLLEEKSTQELATLTAKLLGMMEIGDFFLLTTSLSAANQIRATKEVETASGDR